MQETGLQELPFELNIEGVDGLVEVLDVGLELNRLFEFFIGQFPPTLPSYLPHLPYSLHLEPRQYFVLNLLDGCLSLSPHALTGEKHILGPLSELVRRKFLVGQQFGDHLDLVVDA
jgi:hypothetical protein